MPILIRTIIIWIFAAIALALIIGRALSRVSKDYDVEEHYKNIDKKK